MQKNDKLFLTAVAAILAAIIVSFAFVKTISKNVATCYEMREDLYEKER